MKIGNIEINDNLPPLIVPEIGINHNGDFNRAIEMIQDCAAMGAKIVKFQCHIPYAEMDEIECRKIIPTNSNESIWELIERCSFSEKQEKILKDLTEELGMIYLSTPFSLEAVDRLERMGVVAYKIGSGEMKCTPLIEKIAKIGKPVILSTGMHFFKDIEYAVSLFGEGYPLAILSCTSLYPTPYEKARLGRIKELKEKFPNISIGYSDHTIGNQISYAAIACGANIVEKHYIGNIENIKEYPDGEVSMCDVDLLELIEWGNDIWKATRNDDGFYAPLEEEKQTAKFAFHSIFPKREIKKGEVFTEENITVKRPLMSVSNHPSAREYGVILGRTAKQDIYGFFPLRWEDVGDVKE